MELSHLIYCSAAVKRDFGQEELAELLASCRTKNAAADVTGMLLFQEGSFFQVLEGESTVLEDLFAKISRDPRHRRVTKLALEPIANRAFGAWSMGHPEVTCRQLATIPGLNDFFSSGNSYLKLGEGRAKALLSAFKSGRWRASIS